MKFPRTVSEISQKKRFGIPNPACEAAAFFLTVFLFCLTPQKKNGAEAKISSAPFSSAHQFFDQDPAARDPLPFQASVSAVMPGSS